MNSRKKNGPRHTRTDTHTYTFKKVYENFGGVVNIKCRKSVFMFVYICICTYITNKIRLYSDST